jgi:hypothetical protein
MASDKHGQTPEQRARISEAALKRLKELTKNLPVEVLGHVEMPAACCGNGTVALVKVDTGDPAP